ncbi:MAG: amidohydrolase family protein [Deltaproteobacteria bacterium]|jgi:predicted TIM-barrel fold metal-dependent hydrolase|nr:amidohydrolase family protein [Deltaproteobacteria bacterium]
MSTIIDVDAHFEPGNDWLDPYPELAARLPQLDPSLLAVDAIVGDLLRGVPESERPPLEDLRPPGLVTLYREEKAGEAKRRAEFEGKDQFQVANAKARLAWLDAQGIAIQNVICLSGIAYNLQIPDAALRQEVIRTCNSWLAEICAADPDRLLPVTALEYHDLDFVVDEIERMRALGSRIFLIPAYPVNGIPPAHPSWDRVWSAAVSLGMTPMLHTGFERMHFDPGWANLGGDTTLLRMLGGAHRHVAPMTLLYAMTYSGVFERHPLLTLLLAEVGTGWLPYLMREIDDRTSPTAELFLGSYSLPLKPSEYLARNVRATPLGGGNDQPLLTIMDELPEDMLLFSSDFPHFEGFTDPLGHYREALAGLPQDRVERFLGGSIAEAYARMGDPLVST